MGLEALVEPPETDRNLDNYQEGGYIQAVPKDPWGNDYIYICPGIENPNGYDLESYGADGQDGGEGNDADIESWNLSGS